MMGCPLPSFLFPSPSRGSSSDDTFFLVPSCFYPFPRVHCSVDGFRLGGKAIRKMNYSCRRIGAALLLVRHHRKNKKRPQSYDLGTVWCAFHKDRRSGTKTIHQSKTFHGCFHKEPQSVIMQASAGKPEKSRISRGSSTTKA